MRKMRKMKMKRRDFLKSFAAAISAPVAVVGKIISVPATVALSDVAIKCSATPLLRKYRMPLYDDGPDHSVTITMFARIPTKLPARGHLRLFA